MKKALIITFAIILGLSTILFILLLNREGDLSPLEGGFLMGYIILSLLLILTMIIIILVGGVKLVKNPKLISRPVKKSAIIFLSVFIVTSIAMNLLLGNSNLGAYHYVGFPLFVILLIFSFDAIRQKA